MGILDRVTAIISDGRIDDKVLQSRLENYKTMETKLNETYRSSNIHKDPNYVQEAGEVCDEWISLIADIAMHCGQPLNQSQIDDIEFAVVGSVAESAGFAL